MAKFKVGDKVRVIKEFCEHQVGKIAVIDRYDPRDDDYTYGFESGGWINSESIVLEKPSKSERISLLESKVAALEAQVEALQKPKLTTTFSPTFVSNGVTAQMLADRVVKSVRAAFEPKPTLTELLAQMPSAVNAPNSQRKAVIERAKAFVEEYTKKALGKVGCTYGLMRSYRMKPSFYVNEGKRTVTVLLRRTMYNPGELVGKAIAYCAPDDVFNADIGKAIALGRALGLDVSEFENAVKPTEAVSGQLIQSIERHTGRIRFTHLVSIAENVTSINRELNDGNRYSYAKIIDDTAAQY